METSSLSISIAMATYNGYRHLRRQLDSIAAQSYIPTELVITDDDSEDDTINVINAFAATAPFPVRIYRNEERLGYRANFMRAANLCKSELISFCDQDDFWYPEKIAKIVTQFSIPDVILVYHNANVVGENGLEMDTLADRGAFQKVSPPLSLDPWQFALGFTQVFRKSLLSFSKFWPNSRDKYIANQPLAHDIWIFFLAGVFGKIAYLEEPLANYVQHQSNTFGHWKKANFFDQIKFQFRDRSEEYSNFALAAESRATILELAKDSLEEGVWKKRAAEGCEYYRTVAWLYANRSTVYTAANFSKRLKAFQAVLQKGGYADAWGIKRKSVIPDICLGVPVGHLLRSRGQRF